VSDGLTVPGNNDVALVHASFCSWSLRLQVHYHYTSFATPNRDKLEAEPEIAPRDVPMLLKPCGDTLSSSRRYNEDTPPRSEHRHADRPTRRINSETAFGTLPHAQIKFDPSVDLTATQRPPRADTTRDYAHSCSGRTIFSTNCQSERADGHRFCLKWYWRQIGAINPQQRYVGRVITSNEPSS
jgi:hypothetical protein